MYGKGNYIQLPVYKLFRLTDVLRLTQKYFTYYPHPLPHHKTGLCGLSEIFLSIQQVRRKPVK